MTMEQSYREDFATKNPILIRMEKLYKEDPSFKKEIENYTESYLGLTFGYFLKAAFHEQYLKLDSKEVNGSIIISELSEKPVLT